MHSGPCIEQPEVTLETQVMRRLVATLRQFVQFDTARVGAVQPAGRLHFKRDAA
jgi:hypothetical protein